MRDLQSRSSGENFLLELSTMFSISTITLASSSTSNHLIPSWMARVKPSLNAHNLAITLVMYPIDLKNTLIHLPSLFLINPPLPALPGFPSEALFVLSLCHPGTLQQNVFLVTKKFVTKSLVFHH